MKDTPESIPRIGLGTTSFADNVETLSESEAAKPRSLRLQESRDSNNSPERSGKRYDEGKELTIRSTAARTHVWRTGTY